MRPRTVYRPLAEDINAIDIGQHVRGADGSRPLSGASVASVAAYWADGRRVSAMVHLLTSRPHFGGMRYWYQCPKCGRRAGKLYLPDASEGLACRQCHGLVYRLQYRKDGRTAFLHSLAKQRLSPKALSFGESLAKQYLP